LLIKDSFKRYSSERKAFKEPIFKPIFGDGHAKEEEGREEGGKERREKVTTSN
jgi:hypothetical protein